MTLYEKVDYIKQNVILRYFNEINFDKTNSIYEVAFMHLFNGDLNDIYKHDKFDSLSFNDRKNVLDIVNKYKGLLFYNGNYKYFDESVELCVDVIKDKDFIFGLVIKNYDFLIDLALYDVKIIEELNNFKNYIDFSEYCVMEVIRFNLSDNIKKIEALSEFIKLDNLYRIFDYDKRMILYKYPMGFLYEESNDNFKINTPIEIALKIYNYVNDNKLSIDEVNSDNNLLYKVTNFINSDNIEFNTIVLQLKNDYIISKI